ncbi:MAG: energy transducer TonB [Acidobacteria bacterium]|nr:energy transducer TonB [Acidobacteriota bacterium]
MRQRLSNKVDPEYTSDAREAKCRSTVVLNLIVQQDGTVRDIRVIEDNTQCEKISDNRVTKALALGLSEKAIEAVKQWRFRPGMKSGQPVDVAAIIEVTFRLL